MHGHRQMTATLTLAILLAFTGGILAVAIGQVVFSDPSPTFFVSLTNTISTYGFGFAAWWIPYIFFFSLAVALVGLWRLHWVAYIVSFSLFCILAVFTFNILAAFSAYVVGRFWPLFFSLHPDRFRGVPEWRQMVASGFLAYAVFGSAIYAYAPVQRIARSNTAPAALTVTQPTFVPDQAKLDQARNVLVQLRTFAEVLRAAFETKKIASYPTTTDVVPLTSLRQTLPASAVTVLDDIPLSENIGYWSNGSGFALFAQLPIHFAHPKNLAVTPLPNTVLVRTDDDVLDDLDFDGLPDNGELRWRTNPILSDTDGDGYSDGIEVANGFDPLTPALRHP